ncbi:MAG: UDP-2,3-diacylglucosamine hydrolase [Methanocella sp. PtaU1.Bin125]|nr:MAG: UDP-2,3-diacylglucosamine hydrolase [Methanocella sp. PtaU1.Bin125]
MIIAVSDVHLGCDGSNRDAFIDFLRMCDTPDVEHLVLLGDILDFWRRNNAQVVIENSDVLDMISGLKAKNVHYVVGNHDYSILRLSKRYDGHYQFPVQRSLRLTDGGVKLYFIHGFEMEVLTTYEPLSVEAYEKFCERMCYSEDVLGEYASNLWNWIENRKGAWWRYRSIRTDSRNPTDENKIRGLALSKGKYLLLGMQRDEKLIFGHTHDPFLSPDNMVANTGSWFVCHGGNNGCLLNTYVKIVDGKMELKRFDGKGPL